MSFCGIGRFRKYKIVADIELFSDCYVLKFDRTSEGKSTHRITSRESARSASLIQRRLRSETENKPAIRNFLRLLS
jgi:hypothetical protein